MQFKVEGNRTDVTGTAPSHYCAEEGSGISRLEHLRALERESRKDAVLRDALQKITAIEQDFHLSRISASKAFAKSREVVHEILNALGLE